MNDKKDYYDTAASWAVDTQVESARSRRLAWTAAGIAAAIACFEAVALAMLAPLKTVQPITLLVDRQTGYVTSLDPNSPRRVAADDALTQAFLAQYVMAREGFDRATIATDYRKVALWSAGRARATYLTGMPASNPASPFNHYAPGTVISAEVKSISKLNDGTALVRFETSLADLNGRANVTQPWIATVRYRYVSAPMSIGDRLVNPLGFQVLNYRRDAEAMTTFQRDVDVSQGAGSPAGGLPAATAGSSPVATQTVRSNVSPGSPLASSVLRRQ